MWSKETRKKFVLSCHLEELLPNLTSGHVVESEGGLQLGKEPSVIAVCHCRGRAPSSQCFWPSKPFVKNVLLHILI